jgi:hypothetical protein
MTVVSDDQPDLGYDTVNVHRAGGAVKIELTRCRNSPSFTRLSLPIIANPATFGRPPDLAR